MRCSLPTFSTEVHSSSFRRDKKARCAPPRLSARARASATRRSRYFRTKRTNRWGRYSRRGSDPRCVLSACRRDCGFASQATDSRNTARPTRQTPGRPQASMSASRVLCLSSARAVLRSQLQPAPQRCERRRGTARSSNRFGHTRWSMCASWCRVRSLFNGQTGEPNTSGSERSATAITGVVPQGRWTQKGGIRKPTCSLP